MRRLASTTIVLIAPLLATLAATQVVSAQASNPSLAPSPAVDATAIDAAQVLRAAPVYVDAPGDSGIAYLAG